MEFAEKSSLMTEFCALVMDKLFVWRTLGGFPSHEKRVPEDQFGCSTTPSAPSLRPMGPRRTT